MNRWVGFRCTVASLALALVACQKAPPAAVHEAGPTAAQRWAVLRDRFIEDWFRADPMFAVNSGRHDFDGRLDDFSAEGLAREVARLHAARAEVEAVDAGALPARDRLDRDIALRAVDEELFWREKARWPFRNPAWYIEQIDPDIYVSHAYAPPDVRLRAFIAYARQLPRVAADIRANLKGPMPRSFVELAIDGFGGFADFLAHDVPTAFRDVHDDALQKELADADAAAAREMLGLKAYFLALRPSATGDFALGRDLFIAMLQDSERIDIPLERIEAAGRADLERNTAALRDACAHYLPGATLRACVAREESHKPVQGVIEAGGQDLAALKDFVASHEVVSIPEDGQAIVAEAPPYNRANKAYMVAPGPYEHGVNTMVYLSPPDPRWTAAEQRAYLPGRAALINDLVHEVWPGHYLQYLHTNVNPSKLEDLFVTVGFAEGWAHYSEEVMAEYGLGAGDAELHIAQVKDALERDVRLLSTIGLQAQGMTQAESQRLFRDLAFEDIGTARQQAARGTTDPTYLSYTLGKLMIRKLRTDWIAQRLGGRSATGDEQRVLWREFHDQFLSYGGPPIPLVRAQMLGRNDTPLL